MSITRPTMYEILQAVCKEPILYEVEYAKNKTLTVSYYPKNPGIWLIKFSHRSGYTDYLYLLRAEGIDYEVIKVPDRFSRILKLTKNGAPFLFSEENVSLLERLAKEWEIEPERSNTY